MKKCHSTHSGGALSTQVAVEAAAAACFRPLVCGIHPRILSDGIRPRSHPLATPFQICLIAFAFNY